MVIDTKNTHIAYRCPVCGKGVVSAVGVFSLGADLLRLKCECGGSELTLSEAGEEKIRLNVPCIMCPKPHNYTVSRSLFFGKSMFMLQCPYSDINLCFMGDLEQVTNELERTELELLDMLGEANLERLGEEHNRELLTDPQVFDVIMFVIEDLEAENKIYCNCDDKKGDYKVEMLEDGIRVFCEKCGASRVIPTDSLLGAHAFLTCDRLILE